MNTLSEAKTIVYSNGKPKLLEKFDKLLFNQFNIESFNKIPYDFSTNLDDGEIFFIDVFSEKEFYPNLIKKWNGTTRFDLYENDSNPNFEYIVNVKEEPNKNNIFNFQRITGAQLKTKRFLELGNYKIISIEQNKNISLKEIPDASFDSKKDMLYFFKLSDITAIFPGIISLSKESTKDELDEFIGQMDIQFTEGMSVERIGVNNSKRIFQLKEKWIGISENRKIKIKSYGSNFNIDVKVDSNNKLIVSSDKELKEILFLLDERYYTTSFSNEKREANSIKRIGD